MNSTPLPMFYGVPDPAHQAAWDKQFDEWMEREFAKREQSAQQGVALENQSSVAVEETEPTK